MDSPLHHHPPTHDFGRILLQGAATGFEAGAGFDVEGPLVFGASEGAVVQRGQRDVGALVAAVAVENGEGVAFAGDEQAAAVAVNAGGLTFGQGGSSHDVVPGAFCGGGFCFYRFASKLRAHRFRVKSGQFHAQNDVGGPDDFGQP